jgi:hypothetical protein
MPTNKNDLLCFNNKNSSSINEIYPPARGNAAFAPRIMRWGALRLLDDPAQLPSERELLHWLIRKVQASG